MASQIKLLVIACFILGIYFILIQMQLPLNLLNILVPVREPVLKPVVWFYQFGPHLSIVKSVFESMGYRTELENTSNWDILWTYVYPFYSLGKEMRHLKPYQKVNHFPGSGFITQKANLASLLIEHIPKSFILPDQKEIFMDYAQKHHRKIWVQKSNSHRGIQILDMRNLDLKSSGTFVQEYVSKPLLINNRKFDIGIYVVLTSVNPLRVYVYSGDVLLRFGLELEENIKPKLVTKLFQNGFTILLRFCEQNYYPFNASNTESYVVGSDYLPIWKVPALKRFYVGLNYNAKESLNVYLYSQKKNPGRLWTQIHETIQDVFIQTENALTEASQRFANTGHFFELMRLDFVVDENLDVYLLEANMSPNLSADHFAPNKELYEQVVFNVLSIVGLVRKFPSVTTSRKEIEVSDKDILVFPEECNSKACNSSCRIQKCLVCFPCMKTELKTIAKSAYFEHLNRNKFRRLVPIPIPINFRADFPLQDLKIARPTAMNNFMDRWFKGKCLQDVTFCQ